MRNILLWGSGSQARIIESILNEQHPNFNIENIFDPFNDYPQFKTKVSFSNDPEELITIIKNVSHFIICIGGEHGYARYKTSQALKELNLFSNPIISHKAFIDKTATVGAGVQIMPGSIIHKFVQFGDQCIFNTNSTIDHECIIGNGVHVMPGATISGRVNIKDFCTIGSNATILPDVTIGKGSFIGAGSVILNDVLPYSIMVGVPGKRIKSNQLIYNDNTFKSI